MQVIIIGHHDMHHAPIISQLQAQGISVVTKEEAEPEQSFDASPLAELFEYKLHEQWDELDAIEAELRDWEWRQKERHFTQHNYTKSNVRNTTNRSYQKHRRPRDGLSTRVSCRR